MKKKVLLMGKSNAGKTSMRSIIFANYVARDTMRLGATIDVEHSHVKFLGNLVLNIWDCGGQDTFMENYLQSQRDHIFRNVEVLIYLFDIESREYVKDLQYYKSIVEALKEHSENAQIFCLIHKMDLVAEEQREIVFAQKEAELKKASQPFNIRCYKTSIWDETLYAAWSAIVNALIPNVNTLARHLEHFASVCDADEVVLFERATFLVIASATIKQQQDVHRFEKISNIIKQFKLSSSKLQGAQFASLEVRNNSFAAFMEAFTSNTYIMIVSSDVSIQSASIHMNVSVARQHFEKLQSSSQAANVL
ncbi:mitochondrial P-loop NTPase superfamily member [Andalucia godoyi]|uniref:Mitochondrial P-loop NTPase superfamily member n=1 Tax=Andalucia godoyi TaxID=505711 RepID=A0A8K0AHV6_ANDGO|nr:mitochondrial P-loop NTPase superfamily member [Andalucia godoyi]|eukprot:ANDGO_06471.mRNA.1 mitochondrial P-loop NTPase superfamily member